ncbi:Gp37 family protein [Chitinophaga sp. CF418]|uniref:Gp37 family protein n=1 Tax=Chitinophaga sp. CF418 TaxID=1855287 RepID=UPI00091255C5|nr:Gp37 family protein [Chitinophaga sp. CF418]SHN45927.1 Gp37 protein [Chitinophaga sp. CF418]
MNIYPIQQSIVQKLQSVFSALSLPFEGRDLPDTSKDYDTAVVSPIVYVVYAGSTASPSVTANTIAQERRLRFNAEIHSRLLYRSNGMFVARDMVEQALIGFKPANCQRLYLLQDDIAQSPDDPKLWVHAMQFECVTMLVQKDESDPIIIPSFQELIAKEP